MALGGECLRGVGFCPCGNMGGFWTGVLAKVGQIYIPWAFLVIRSARYLLEDDHKIQVH